MNAQVGKQAPGKPAGAKGGKRSFSRFGTLFAQGEPYVWLTAGGLVTCVAMIVVLLWHVVSTGLATFWPQPLVQMQLLDGGSIMGELVDSESYAPQEQDFDGLTDEQRSQLPAGLSDGSEAARRTLLRTGNFDLTNTHFQWVSNFKVQTETEPEWGAVVERLAWGRFYGTLVGFSIDGELQTEDPAESWELYAEHHGAVRERFEERYAIEQHEIGLVNREEERARLKLRDVELKSGLDSSEWRAENEAYLAKQKECLAQSQEMGVRIRELNDENARYRLAFETASGQPLEMSLDQVVRAFTPNRMSWTEKLGVYGSRWHEFVFADPRESNSEGGVFPAIFGTVVMTLIMSILVVPFGVLAALYMREYAKQGLMISAVRIAVNNLAGVPSIVFGVFGLGFFCYIIGGTIDQLFYTAQLPNPKFGTGGLMWASLTLALLTLPVVIVATEEALSAVPSSMREGSYACGATKWQTIQRIVLPRAMPGIMTGMILAIARGAGEVAPLMLVGAVKLSLDLPVDLSNWSGSMVAPTGPVHFDRSFMHLGFHIYDLGFQSQNIMAATPMVYTTTLLLISIIVALNLAAIWVRARLRRKFLVSAV